MIYDFKDDCATGGLCQKGWDIHRSSDKVFSDHATDLWDHMKSHYEDD